MRYLILADLHANLPALDAVIAAAHGSWDRVIVLGDLVGYAAEPNEVIDRIQSFDPLVVIRGNHDKVAAGLEPAEDFNAIARRAIAWTAAQLTPEHRAYLAALPLGPAHVDEEIEACHGTPFDEDTYVFDDATAGRALQAIDRPLCLFGHTHVPAHYRLTRGRLDAMGLGPDHLTIVAWEADGRALVNCGSVGQPRDGDPRAAFGIVDTEARQVRCYRVPYPIDVAQARIRAAGLPEMLAARLGVGR